MQEETGDYMKNIKHEVELENLVNTDVGHTIVNPAEVEELEGANTDVVPEAEEINPAEVEEINPVKTPSLREQVRREAEKAEAARTKISREEMVRRSGLIAPGKLPPRVKS
jgi:hypothetical protein